MPKYIYIWFVEINDWDNCIFIYMLDYLMLKYIVDIYNIYMGILDTCWGLWGG